MYEAVDGVLNRVRREGEDLLIEDYRHRTIVATDCAEVRGLLAEHLFRVCDRTGAVVCTAVRGGRKKVVGMGRLLLSAVGGGGGARWDAEHVDGDQRNCRLANLRKVAHVVANPRSNTGVAGVSRSRGGRGYVASWMDAKVGHVKNKKFTFAKYRGEAFTRATAWREAMCMGREPSNAPLQYIVDAMAMPAEHHQDVSIVAERGRWKRRLHGRDQRRS